jgi:hypothetical protein
MTDHTCQPFPEAELVSGIENGGGVEGQLALVLLYNVAEPVKYLGLTKKIQILNITINFLSAGPGTA